jgi:hypothetical protein
LKLAALTLVAASCAATALAAKSRPIHLLTVVGQDETAWDADTGGEGIFTPVDDGTTFEGGYVHLDAFDQGLELEVDGTPFVDPDGEATVKNNAYTVGPTRAGDLRVRRYERVRGPYLRTLIELKNTSNAPVETEANIHSDLGSDGDETVIDSSNAAAGTYELDDRWVISTQDDPPVVWEDPALTFVTYGPGGEPPATLEQGFGSGDFEYDYEARVPANKTRYLLLFTEMHGFIETAQDDTAKYDDANLNAKLLGGIAESKHKAIVNWDLG